jgi:hypothetical protein
MLSYCSGALGVHADSLQSDLQLEGDPAVTKPKKEATKYHNKRTRLFCTEFLASQRFTYHTFNMAVKFAACEFQFCRIVVHWVFMLRGDYEEEKKENVTSTNRYQKTGLL